MSIKLRANPSFRASMLGTQAPNTAALSATFVPNVAFTAQIAAFQRADTMVGSLQHVPPPNSFVIPPWSLVQGTPAQRDVVALGFVTIPPGETFTSMSWNAGSAAHPGMSISGSVISWDGSGATGTYSGLKNDVLSSAAVSTASATLTLTSAVTGVGVWTFGYPFRQTDIPGGQFITGNSTTFQADVRNRWPDGSVKFAVLSGSSSFTANTPVPVTLSATNAAPTGTNITEPTGAEVGVAQVVLTGAGAGTYSLSAVLNIDRSTWSRGNGGRLRQFLGPVMSEFHYYQPTSDTHLAIYWYVRKYSSTRMEIECAVEQGWTRVAGATTKTYTASVTVGGSTTNLGSINHSHHARWSLRNWIGTNPGITPKHDRAYLGATKLFPNFANITPASDSTVDSTGLAQYVQSAAPMTQGNYPSDGTSTGAHAFLGLISEWSAAYVINGDVRAYRAMLANEQAENCCSMASGPAGGTSQFGFINRDESTGLPGAPPDYTADSYASPSGTVVVGTGTGVWTTDQSHGMNAGYAAYLITGRWFSLETCQFNTISEFLVTNRYTATVARIAEGHVQDRGQAWMMRTAACALAITPDTGSTLRAKYITTMQQNISDWRTNEVGLNNLGLKQNVYTGGGSSANDSWGPTGKQNVGAFMHYFLTMAFAFARDICAGTLSSAAQTQFNESVNFHCTFPVGLLGTRPAGYCYRSAARYGMTIGPTYQSLTRYASFQAMYDAMSTDGTVPVDAVCAAGQNLIDTYFIFTSYWGNFNPAIVAAVDNGNAGAAQAYGRMTGAPNWNGVFVPDMPHAPQWAMVPRAAVAPTTYSTSFPTAESALSEGGLWTGGGSTGALWTNMRTTGGNAIPTHGGVNYDDSIDHLNGFAADHFIEGTVFLSGTFSQNQELELLLRFQITPNNARGIEVTWPVSGGGAVVRWNGALGDFTVSPQSVPSFGVPVNGDVLRAEVRGTTVTFIKNGVTLSPTVSITGASFGGGATWTDGQPGIGGFTRDTSGAQNLRAGWQSINAGNLP